LLRVLEQHCAEGDLTSNLNDRQHPHNACRPTFVSRVQTIVRGCAGDAVAGCSSLRVPSLVAQRHRLVCVRAVLAVFLLALPC
jgi:hypothetical protein